MKFFGKRAVVGVRYGAKSHSEWVFEERGRKEFLSSFRRVYHVTDTEYIPIGVFNESKLCLNVGWHRD